MNVLMLRDVVRSLDKTRSAPRRFCNDAGALKINLEVLTAAEPERCAKGRRGLEDCALMSKQ